MNDLRETKGSRASRGASLVLVAVGLVMLTGALALAIDLGMLYVARNEAQRAADAAALAGAYAFVASGCTSAGDCVNGGAQETAARRQAVGVGAQNSVLGQAAAIEDADIRFTYPSPREPQISVIVRRTRERGNPIPTIFARMFDILQADVSATATAEAYNGGVANTCIAPFLVPNCDPLHTSPSNSVFCGTDVAAGPFVDTDTGALIHGSRYPGGVVGEQWQLHFGAGPSDSAVASQWYLLALAGNSSGSDLRDFISRCYPRPIACGDSLETYDGKSVGPLNQGVIARIGADGLGMNLGQDTIDTSKDPSVWITGGYNNADFNGKTIAGVSRSLVSVPIYDGHPLVPGGETVRVVGFMQMFLEDVEHRTYGGQGSYDVTNAVIVNISGCDPKSGAGSTITAGSPIAVRLIRP
jgi:hypothetical protein